MIKSMFNRVTFCLAASMAAQATLMQPVLAQSSDNLPIRNIPSGISADSKRIYFQSLAPNRSGERISKSFSMNLTGQDIRTEARVGMYPGWPSLTKDGKRVALHTEIAGNWELVVLDLNTPNNMADFNKVERLTHGTKADYFATWSPDEKSIAFYSTRTGNPQIFVMDLKTKKVTNISNNDEWEQDPTWSSNGEITFQSDVSGNREIWTMKADGSERKNITNSPADDHWGAWSPDGEEIVFSSDRDGSQNLYIMLRDGSGLRQLTDSPSTDHWPRWAPDGTFITFERETDSGGDVFSVRPDGSGETKLTHGENYHK